jgi:hypothetical protein
MPVADDDELAGHIAAALAPCRQEGLLSRHAIADICRSEGGSLPAGMTSLFGFECRLGEEEPTADFLVRIGAGPGEWPVLERHAASQAGAVWQRIASLLGERSRPGSSLAPMLKNLWLEYDLVGRAGKAAAPGLFFGTDRLTQKAEAGWACELAAQLRGAAVSAALGHRVSGLVAALPEAARLFQIGIMGSRPHAPLRVCIIGQKFDEESSFLAAMGWPGELPRVVETLRRFAPATDHVALDLDIGDDGRIAPKLGIELYLKLDSGPSPPLIELIDRLRQANLCLPQKAEGLFGWAGITHERLHPELWPAALLAGKALRRGGESSTFCRWLHHVKIVIEPDAPPTAKAYLAVGHAYLADSAIREVLQRAALGKPP